MTNEHRTCTFGLSPSSFTPPREQKRRLLYCLLFTFIIGFVVHGYAFTNFTVSHDSLAAFYAASRSELRQKLVLGRFMAVPYRLLLARTIVLPWLTGLFSLFWVSLAVYLIATAFEISSRLQIALISCCMTTPVYLTALFATYGHDADGYLFGMLLAVAAFYLWYKGASPVSFFAASFLLSLGMGFYQSNLCTCVILILIALAWDLLDAPLRSWFRKAWRGFFQLLAGCVLYFLEIIAVRLVSGVTPASGTYNSLDHAAEPLTASGLFTLIIGAYRDWFQAMFFRNTLYASSAVITCGVIAMVAILLGCLCAVLRHRDVRRWLLALLLLLLMPLGMNVVYIASRGLMHDLMRYSYCFVGVFMVLFVFRLTSKRQTAFLLCVPLLFLMYNNLVTANAVYVEKDMQRTATLSLMTKVSMRMDETDGYDPESTPVLFVGSGYLRNGVSAFDSLDMTGNYSTYIQYTYFPDEYFKYVLMTPFLSCDDWNSEIADTLRASDKVEAMGRFPAQDSIQMIDGVLVVKL